MLEEKDIKEFHCYRGKVFQGKDKGPNNDRTIILIDKKAKTVQYDSDSVSYRQTALPVIPLAEFLDWAEREITEEEADRYYVAKEPRD